MHEDHRQDNPLNVALFEAVAAGSLDRVRELLDSGADPNFLGPRWLTPLNLAAALGFEEIAEALLAAKADPDWRSFGAASGAGYHGVARLIREWRSRNSAVRRREQLNRLGWSVGLQQEDSDLVLTGTEPVDDVERVIELSKTEKPTQPEVPFTTFEGWTKQLVAEDLTPIALEALESALPLFIDLAVPRDDWLAKIPEHLAKKVERLRPRARRFAGDDGLPRSRYYTLCKDELGNDGGTLVCEMWVYSDIRRTGKISLIDMADPTAPQRLTKMGLEEAITNSVRKGLIWLVFLPGPDSGLSPFLLRLGIAQRTFALQLPLRVVHQRIEKVVDLRIPTTADWFARTMSQAVLGVQSPKGNVNYFKCWPLRPPLNNFGQLLPSMLTQELGGGYFSIVAGILLRQAGAAALIFPSARNDPRLRVKDGNLLSASGWNLVDYRNAPPPKQRLVLNVDQSWPSTIGVGPNNYLWDKPRPDLFKTASIDYEDTGQRYGSFEVEGIINDHWLLRKIELESYRNDESPRPWWLV